MRDLSHQNLQIGGCVVAFIGVAYIVGLHLFVILTILVCICFVVSVTVSDRTSSDPTRQPGLMSKLGKSLFPEDGKMFKNLYSKDKHNTTERNHRTATPSSFRSLRSPTKVANENLNSMNSSSSGPLLSPFLPRARRVYDSFSDTRSPHASLTERVMLSAQRRYPTHQAKYGSLGSLPSVRLSRPARHALTDRNSSMLQSPVTVKIAAPDVITNKSPLVSRICEDGNSILKTNPCDTSTVITALREKRKRTLKDQSGSSPAAPEQEAKRRRQGVESPASVQSDASSAKDSAALILPNGDIASAEVRANLKRPALSRPQAHDTSPENSSKRVKPNEYVTQGPRNAIASSYSSTKRMHAKERGSGTGQSSSSSRDSSMSRDSCFSQDTSFSKDWMHPHQQMLRQETTVIPGPALNDSRSSTPNFRMRHEELGQVDSRSTSPASSLSQDVESDISETRNNKKRLFQLTKSNSSKRRNTPIYSPLAGGAKVKVAPQASCLTEEDYENDRKADEDRVQQMLLGAGPSLQLKEGAAVSVTKSVASALSQNVSVSSLSGTINTSTQANTPLLSSLFSASSASSTAATSPLTSALALSTSSEKLSTSTASLLTTTKAPPVNVSSEPVTAVKTSTPNLITTAQFNTASSIPTSSANETKKSTSVTSVLGTTSVASGLNVSAAPVLSGLVKAPGKPTSASSSSSADSYSANTSDISKVLRGEMSSDAFIENLKSSFAVKQSGTGTTQPVSSASSSTGTKINIEEVVASWKSAVSSTMSLVTSSAISTSKLGLGLGNSGVSLGSSGLDLVNSSPKNESIIPKSSASSTAGGVGLSLSTSDSLKSLPTNSAGFSFRSNPVAASTVASTMNTPSSVSAAGTTVSSGTATATTISSAGSNVGGFSFSAKAPSGNFSFGSGQGSSVAQNPSSVQKTVTTTSSTVPSGLFAFGSDQQQQLQKTSNLLPASSATLTTNPAPTFSFGSVQTNTAKTESTQKPAAVGGFSFASAQSSTTTATAPAPQSATSLVFNQRNTTPTFAFGQNDGTKSSTAAPLSGGFSFGNASSNNSNANAPQSSGFVFNSSSSSNAPTSTPATGGFSFSATTQAPASSANLFSLGGGTASKVSTTSSTFSFGTNNTKPSTGSPFTFGGNSAQTTTTTANSFAFGGNPSSGSVFSQPAPVNAPANPTTQASSVFAFGASGKDGKKQEPAFGQPNPGGGVFGGVGQSNTSTSIFATPKQTPVFGTGGSGSAFTTPPQQQQQQPAPNQNAFSFGSSKPAPSSGFDFSKAGAPSGGFSFGGAQNPAPAAVPFGQSTPQQLVSGTGFNFNSMPAAPAFGSVTPSSNPPQFATPGASPAFGAVSNNMFSVGAANAAPRPRANVRARRRVPHKR